MVLDGEPVLLLDYIRPINKDEQLLLDYGVSFETDFPILKHRAD